MASAHAPSEATALQRDRQRRLQTEVYWFFRDLTALLLAGFCIAIPLYIYASNTYDFGCVRKLGPWQWSFTIFLWVLLAASLLGAVLHAVLSRRDQGSPGAVLLTPALIAYAASVAWLIVGTVRLATTDRDLCDTRLYDSTLGLVIAAWVLVVALALTQAVASIALERMKRKAGTQQRTAAASNTAGGAAAGGGGGPQPPAAAIGAAGALPGGSHAQPLLPAAAAPPGQQPMMMASGRPGVGAAAAAPAVGALTSTPQQQQPAVYQAVPGQLAAVGVPARGISGPGRQVSAGVAGAAGDEPGAGTPSTPPASAARAVALFGGERALLRQSSQPATSVAVSAAAVATASAAGAAALAPQLPGTGSGTGYPAYAPAGAAAAGAIAAGAAGSALMQPLGAPVAQPLAATHGSSAGRPSHLLQPQPQEQPRQGQQQRGQQPRQLGFQSYVAAVNIAPSQSESGTPSARAGAGADAARGTPSGGAGVSAGARAGTVPAGRARPAAAGAGLHVEPPGMAVAPAGQYAPLQPPPLPPEAVLMGGRALPPMPLQAAVPMPMPMPMPVPMPVQPYAEAAAPPVPPPHHPQQQPQQLGQYLQPPQHIGSWV